MTSLSESSAIAATHPSLPRGLRGRLPVYVRLTKAWMYYHWAPVILAWTLLPSAAASNGRDVTALALFAISVMLGCSAGAALDDVQGFVDGIDQRTYSRGQGLRTASRKPLVQGEIGVEEARRVGITLAVIAIVLLVTAIVIAPHHPIWLVAGGVAVATIGMQYSYGLRISYTIGNEIVLAVATGLALVIPYLFVTGGLSWPVTIETFLVAGFMAQVTIFSNSADAHVDRQAGRMTVATRLGLTGNRRFVTMVFATGWTLAAIGLVGGALNVWVALALVPCWTVQAFQLYFGVGRGEWLRGRALGWRAFNLGLLALLAGNLLAPASI